MVSKIELLQSPHLTPLEFCLWVWIKGEVYKRKVDTREELLARVLDAADRNKKLEDQLRRTARYLLMRVAKCIEVGGGIFYYIL
jgi:hypothetical protein